MNLPSENHTQTVLVKNHKDKSNFGATKLDGLQVYQGLLIELIITLLLVLTVLAVVDTRRKDLGGSGPLAIGLCVTACHIPFVSSGCKVLALCLVFHKSFKFFCVLESIVSQSFMFFPKILKLLEAM